MGVLFWPQLGEASRVLRHGWPQRRPARSAHRVESMQAVREIEARSHSEVAMRQQAHVELIIPSERLHPTLGGTGYLEPKPAFAATTAELIQDASRQQTAGVTVWKVSRPSVGWHKGKARNHRFLRVGKSDVLVNIVGSNRHWYFVSVNCADAVRILTRSRRDAIKPLP